VNIPANLSMVYAPVFTFFKFDLLPDIDSYMANMNNNEPVPDDPPTKNYYAIGYETSLSLYNLGSLFFFNIAQLLLFVVIVILSRFKKQLPKFDQFLVKRGCKWNFFVQILIANFFVWVMVASIGAKNINLRFRS